MFIIWFNSLLYHYLYFILKMLMFFQLFSILITLSCNLLRNLYNILCSFSNYIINYFARILCICKNNMHLNLQKWLLILLYSTLFEKTFVTQKWCIILLWYFRTVRFFSYKCIICIYFNYFLLFSKSILLLGTEKSFKS